VQNRQCEGGGFASPSLGNSNHVAARHDDRNRLRLDRCRNDVLFLCECAHDRVVKGEVMKGGQWRNFLVFAFAQPPGDTPRPAARAKKTPRAIWAVSEFESVRARSRLTGSRTRGSPQADQAADPIWAGKLFVSRRMINRRAPCRLPVWPIEALSIAPSFHESFGCWPDIPSWPSRLLCRALPF